VTEWQPLWKVPAVLGLRVRVEGEEGRIVGFVDHLEVIFRDAVIRPMVKVDLDRGLRWVVFCSQVEVAVPS